MRRRQDEASLSIPIHNILFISTTGRLPLCLAGGGGVSSLFMLLRSCHGRLLLKSSGRSLLDAAGPVPLEIARCCWKLGRHRQQQQQQQCQLPHQPGSGASTNILRMSLLIIRIIISQVHILNFKNPLTRCAELPLPSVVSSWWQTAHTFCHWDTGGDCRGIRIRTNETASQECERMTRKGKVLYVLNSDVLS